MSLASQAVARRMHLIEPQTLDVVCEQDLRVPMDDGAVLLADRWAARASADRPQPTVLVRSPYGRRQYRRAAVWARCSPSAGSRC